jgi:hypothetical protein
MLTAVQLDDHPSLDTDEVTNIRPNRTLASELEITQLTTAKLAPEEPFGISWILAENARELVHAPK